MKKEIIAKNKKHLQQLINDCIEKEGHECDLNYINTYLITDMSYLFRESNFNGDISNWSVSNVKYMNGIFANSKFSGDISEWNVSNVVSMGYMFHGSKFMGNISQWNVSNVTSMNGMFAYSEFNGDISNWDVSSVKKMVDMFAHSKFNGDISRWDVSKVVSILGIFYNCNIDKIPYWTKIENAQHRKLAVESYLNKKILEKIISPDDGAHVIHKI